MSSEIGVNLTDFLDQTIEGIDENYRKVGKVETISGMVNLVINLLLGVVFAGSIVGLAYSFIQFILSKGEKDALAKAKTGLTWSVIVLIITFFVVVLKRVLFSAIGVNNDINKENQGF